MEKETTKVNEMNFYEKLVKIQCELVANKNQRNDFGKFTYRKAEDIMSALKPLLYKYNCTLYITDEVFELNANLMIKTSITLVNIDNGAQIVTSSPCVVDMTHKGMSKEQCSGSSLSYSRKYALGALFLIDDSKDPDELKPKDDVEAMIERAETESELKAIWFDHRELWNDDIFKELINSKKIQILSNNKK